MLNLLMRGAPCPCCAYAMAPAVLRRSTLAQTLPPRATATSCEARISAPLGDLRIVGATVVDPRDGSMLSNVSILIKNGRIVALEKDGSFHSSADMQLIDAAGKFVVPGYNDMHTHVLELDNPSGALALMLAEGVTGFRQMSGSPNLLEERRSQTLPVGKDAPAALEMPGTVLTPLNAGSSDAVVAEIKLQRELGADFIKVGFVSPPVFIAAMQEAKRIGMPILGHLQDGVDALVACKAGFRSVEHLGPGATLWIACSSAEEQLKSEAKPVLIKAPPLKIPFLKSLILWRLQTLLINPAAFVPPEYVARLQRAIDTFSEEKCRTLAQHFADEGTWHVPTLVRLRTQELADLPEYAVHPYLQYMPEKKVKKWKAVTRKFKKLPRDMRETYAGAYSRQLALTQLLANSGVRMMTGTDGGWLSGPGMTLKEEFAELGKAGLTPLQILQMTTINAAEYLGRTDTMGTVEIGRNADLVLLDANPLEKVTNLHEISGVVRAGVHYSRQDLDSLCARVASSRGYLN
jgi:imidazolonepropionase-like amidohydrolase